ncbi:winged helix DNA-binding domain-containing protein [Rhodobacter sp. Har01]|uniref:winged helix-turn-helix domain-containing protein n=1 Tax=Rhodobacter sp. Har01 TaxID=2883999 RepID=UPI001D0945BF|nr:crosslink repair DNA glycosylase YcaQ family protein [Rhodobacter sp. Har01]MCB6179824.1 winged helix DNA-binding domain-containing protein [Rhodobacter sp. Har01]
MALPVIDNLTARRLFLDRHALAEAPVGPSSGAALGALIDRIGFVQVDSINTVERAHHMILWSRRQGYRPEALKPLLERDRVLWEHWTHDASVLPVSVYGHWKHRFARDRGRLVESWTGWQREGFHEKFDAVLKQVADGGPVSSSEVGEGEARGKGGWWDWHPSKAALEYLWRVGELAVCRRDGFRKVYDLTERVIPAAARGAAYHEAETVDWACSSALDRLGFATSGELAAYWGLVGPEAAKGWVRGAVAAGRVVEAEVGGWTGARRRVVVWPEVLDEVPPEPPGRLRVLSPFDPALRDRARAEHLFGFVFRIEVFVPEPKRQFGYYVFPLLEGDRLVGRLDAKAHRDGAALKVRAVWPEAGVRMGTGRQARLAAELDRLARFAGCDRVDWLPGWDRSA